MARAIAFVFSTAPSLLALRRRSGHWESGVIARTASSAAAPVRQGRLCICNRSISHASARALQSATSVSGPRLRNACFHDRTSHRPHARARRRRPRGRAAAFVRCPKRRRRAPSHASYVAIGMAGPRRTDGEKRLSPDRRRLFEPTAFSARSARRRDRRLTPTASGSNRWCSALPLIIDLFGRGPGENDGLNWPHCDGVGASEAIALASRQPLAVVSSSLARWPTTHAARGCRIGLMQLSALSPGPCSLQPLVRGCAVSNWQVPLTVCGTGAVRSRSDGSGPLDATFAAAFWSA